MQKFFSNKKLIVLMVALLTSFGLMFASMAVRNNRATPPLVQQVGNDLYGLAARVVAVPTRAVSGVLDNLHDLMNAFDENKALKAQVEDLAQTKVQVQTLKDENKQLKTQLHLSATLTDYQQVQAAVMLRAPSDWRNMVTINQGSAAGIEKGMPVMAGSGVIGRVVEVNKTNAKVEMMSTDNRATNRFAAQVVVPGKDPVAGVITGYDVKTSQLMLGQLNTATAIKKGDQVVTSGLGGLTPKGLLIGTVTEVKKDDYGLADTVYLKPAADLNDISVVTVIMRTIEGDR